MHNSFTHAAHTHTEITYTQLIHTRLTYTQLLDTHTQHTTHPQVSHTHTTDSHILTHTHTHVRTHIFTYLRIRHTRTYMYTSQLELDLHVFPPIELHPLFDTFLEETDMWGYLVIHFWLSCLSLPLHPRLRANG